MNVELGHIEVHDLRPIREIVFEKLREAIFDGKIKKGEHLVESVIADKMNVSRTPVREALRQLEIEGLVLNIPRRGAIVQGITEEDAIEIYDLREVLEGLVARMACKNATEDEIRKLKIFLELMEEAIKNKENDEYLKLLEGYNLTLLNSAKSKRLEDMVKKLYEYLESLRSVSLDKEDRRIAALKEHKKIVSIIEKRDEETAEMITRRHVKKAKETFLKNRT